MKRSRIKKKPRKPTPVHDAYGNVVGFDEPLFYLGRFLEDCHLGIDPFVRRGVEFTKDLETNHLWSLHRRLDVRSNQIRIRSRSHRWFHANLAPGRVLCLLTKSIKGDLIIDEINEAAGKLVPGWVETVELPEWCEVYREELLERLKS